MQANPLALTPINDCLLVELSQSFSNVRTKDGKYQAYTEGMVITLPTWINQADKKLLEPDNKIILSLPGKRIFFEEYKEGGHIRRDGKEFAFIKLDDVRGFEDIT